MKDKKPKIQSFKVWSAKFIGQDTQFGDLAGDIKRDKSFPGGHSYIDLYFHISEKQACSEAKETLARAFVAYAMEHKEVNYEEALRDVKEHEEAYQKVSRHHPELKRP